MLIIKTFDKRFEEWGDEADDFYVSYDVGIGSEEISGECEVFALDIISPKRLEKVLVDGVLMVPRGYMITSDFNVKQIENEINKIIKKCETKNYDDTYNNLSKFLRWNEDSMNY